VLDHVNRLDGFSMKKPFLASARGASFHTKHASNVNVVLVVLLYLMQTRTRPTGVETASR
jgi:hypothetical protein